MQWFIYFLRHLKWIGWTSSGIAALTAVLTWNNASLVPYLKIVDHLGNVKLFNNLLDSASIFTNYFFISFLTFTVGVLIYYFFLEKEEIEIKRGATLDTADNVKRAILKYMKKNNGRFRMTLSKAKIPLGFTEEVRNFLFIGKAGAGKTQLIYNTFLGNVKNHYKKKYLFFGKKELVQIEKISKGVADFKEPMICYERKGDDFVGPFYVRGNPDYHLFDPRDIDSIKWNIFDDLLTLEGEIDESMVDYYTNSLQPVGDGKDSHFQKQAQAVVKAILLKIAGGENPSNKSLIDYLLANGNLKDLRDSLLNDPTVLKFGAANFVRNSLTVDDKGSPDGQGNSVVATLNDTFKQLCRREFYYAEGNFSIRQWLWSLKEGNRDTRLFIVNTSEQAGAYARYFSLFISLIYKHGLALPNHKSRRIWFILDEIQSLGSGGNQALGQYLISELVNFLAESRSKGFSVTAATQSLPQLEKLIEMEGMRALFQLLSNKFFLQYDEPIGAKFITDFLGSSEQEKTKKGLSKGGQIGQDKLSENEEEKMKQAVLESELGLLEPLTSYTKLGNFPVCKMEFDYQEPPKSCENPLVRRVLPFFDEPEDKEAIAAAAKLKVKEDSINEVYEDIMKMIDKKAASPKVEAKKVVTPMEEDMNSILEDMYSEAKESQNGGSWDDEPEDNTPSW